jgi:glycosyltransferase involved in cell wall biosynthesis
MLQPALALFHKREDNIIVTVSNYSKSSIMYNFNIKDDKIHVKYSPERIYTDKESNTRIESNEILKRLVDEKVKYYLIVSANRDTKNAKKALHAFESYAKIRSNMYVVTIGYGKTLFDNHIDLPFLSDIDLREAFKNCYALLYPSLFEGFGYPPLEAMKYGKPVLVSNVCSMPEVLDDAPIYFSPVYETAIFNALMTLNDENYSEFSKKSIQRYQFIHEKQERDLTDLMNMILGKTTFT